MNGDIVNRNEVVSLEEVQEFIEKVIEVLINQTQEIFNIIIVQCVKMSSDASCVHNHITSFMP